MPKAALAASADSVLVDAEGDASSAAETRRGGAIGAALCSIVALLMLL